MPYDKMGMADGNGGDMPNVKPAMDDSADKNSVMLSSDHFPDGMAPKKGEKLTFCVTGDPDSEGNVMGYFEPMGGKQDDGTSWEDDFKKEMSPSNPQPEAA